MEQSMYTLRALFWKIAVFCTNISIQTWLQSSLKVKTVNRKVFVHYFYF